MFLYYIRRCYQLGFAKCLDRMSVWICDFFHKCRDRLVYFFGYNGATISDAELGTFLSLLGRFNNFVFDQDLFRKIRIIPEKPDQFDGLSSVYLFNQKVAKPQDGFSFWHTDWSYGAGGWYLPDKIPFFSDVKITISSDKSFVFGKDIKVAWESGRMQYLSTAALAYLNLSDGEEKKNYLDFIKRQLQGFLINCPYLGGVAWQNPMEVGIRAVNVLFTLAILNKEIIVWDKGFLRDITQSLINHQNFIESYLETSITPNNHYLADLISHLYLKVLLRKVEQGKIKNQIVFVWQEFCKQLLADGCFYEGSSAYHRLNLEMMAHLCLLDTFLQAGQTDAAFLEKRVAQLFLACESDGFYLNIGDNDSGRFVFGCHVISPRLPLDQKLQILEFPDFGLVVVKNYDNLISLRCYNYDPQKQPSGHYHQDQLAMVVRLAGQNIFVDGGTGVYTANSDVRNLLRSPLGHTTFYSQQQDDLEQLFLLHIPQIIENKIIATVEIRDGMQVVELIAKFAERKSSVVKFWKRQVLIVYNLESARVESIIITDEYGGEEEILNWNWLLSPHLLLDLFDSNAVRVSAGQDQYLFTSTVPLQFQAALFSQNYKNIEACLALRGNKNAAFAKTVSSLVLQKQG